MPYVAQNLISQKWTVIDLNSPPGIVSGLTVPADVTLDLMRTSGASIVAADEVMTWTETAVPGSYAITLTPQNSGTYFLTVTETSVLTTQRQFLFTYEILPAGAVFTPSAAGCFCAESDIERYFGFAFTASSPVTSTMALGFAEERAASIMAWCKSWGADVTPATVTIGSRLEDLLRAANAIGAAIDAAISWYTQVEPAENEKARALMLRWVQLMGDGEKLIGTIETEIETNVVGGLESSHILSGDTTERANENAPQDIGLQFRAGDIF